MKNYFTKTKAQKRLSTWRTVGLFTFLIITGMQSAKAQYTAIPDANFEQALFDQGIDTVNGDHQVLTSNVSGLTSLYVSSKNIANLTGIQAFTGLTNLYCSNNLLTSLNVSGLTDLSVLYCNENKLTSLNLSGCSSLQSLNCRYNYLPALNFSNTPNLTYLVCGSNKFTSLNVTSLTNLNFLNCNYYHYNEGSYLVLYDLFNSDTYISDTYTSQNNPLTTLNVSGLTHLETLWCSNTISSLNLSGLTSLFDFHCQNNISTIDLSGSTNLHIVDLSSNPLTTLNISNLNNLTELQLAFTNVSSLNASGLIHLTTLTVQDCPLTNLNVTGCSALVDLNCSHAKLSTLSLTGCSSLQTLQCADNKLTSLNLSGLSALKTLICGNWYDVPGSRNQITSINFTGATSLTSISCEKNLLSTLNLSGLTNLEYLDCHNNAITTLNLTGLNALVTINCSNNVITVLTLPGTTSLTSLECYNNQISALTLSGFVNLDRLNVESNLLTSLDLRNLTNLNYMGASNNSMLFCISTDNVNTANANPNWTKDGTTNYSTNCNGYIPTSKVKANQCGTTLATLDANINADYVVGYQAYRFEVSNGTTFNTIEVNKYNFSLIQTPGITYGTTYGVRVAVKMGGTWGTYGASCNITTPNLVSAATLPTIQILAADCGTTLASLSTPIHAKWTYGAENYRFEVSNGGTVTTYDSPIYYFNLTKITGAVYGTTYSIRVAYSKNGIWSDYGTSCSVTTPTLSSNIIPTTQIHPNFCGATLAALDTKIPASPIYNATGYRFEISTGGVTTIYDSTTYNFKLSQAGVVVTNGTTYAIRVAALVNGVYGNYGASCNVYTPGATAREFAASTEFAVAAYPNPFNSTFKLHVTASTDETIFVSVYDMMGKQIENREVNASEIENATIGQDYANGIYNVLVSQGVNTKTVRLVKN